MHSLGNGRNRTAPSFIASRQRRLPERYQGFEGARNSTKPSETEVAPTENQKSGSVTHILARRGCSKCSEAAHLGRIVVNALRNGDLFKALELLEEVAAGDGNGRASGRRE